MAEFPILPEDEEYLDSNFSSNWNMVTAGSERGIIISKYKLPERYMPEKSDLMIIVPPNYPGAAIDMFYFSPGVARKDGATIGALESETHFDIIWQRWSRHYPWNPAIHSIVSHILYVRNELLYQN